MNWIVVLLILAAAGTVFGARRGLGMVGKGSTSVDSIVRNGREGLRLLLARVEREEEPELVRGAMCYRPAAVPERVEYICPVCGERTWYGGDCAVILHGQMNGIRRAMTELEQTPYFKAFLDESQFCSSCVEGETESPRFFLVLAYPEGDTIRTSVQLFDLQMLVGLVRGELDFADSFDARLPLKSRVGRLRVILGIE